MSPPPELDDTIGEDVSKIFAAPESVAAEEPLGPWAGEVSFDGTAFQGSGWRLVLDAKTGILRVKRPGDLFMKFTALSAGRKVGEHHLKNKRIVAGLCMPHALGATFLLHMTPARSSVFR